MARTLIMARKIKHFNLINFTILFLSLCRIRAFLILALKEFSFLFNYFQGE